MCTGCSASVLLKQFISLDRGKVYRSFCMVFFISLDRGTQYIYYIYIYIYISISLDRGKMYRLFCIGAVRTNSEYIIR